MEYITGVITLQAIFSMYWRGYLAWFKGVIRPAVHENVQKILMCRTPQLGFHAFKCPTCRNIKLMPHSCKSRFCSSCGKVATDKWVEERLTDILDVEYHHLVFTLPWQLRSICLLNREIMFNLLFKAVSESIISWCKKFVGYIPGFYTVLHTFGSDLIPRIVNLLNKKKKQRKVKKDWRGRLNDYTGHDPLCCDNCGGEMILFYVCYGPEKGILKKLGLHEWERIPIKQFQI